MMGSTVRPLLAAFALAILALTPPMQGRAQPAPGTPDDVYTTYGVHNDANPQDCKFPNCVYPRKPGEDPTYPAYWTSHWAMYRVFNHYQDNPPPYPGRPKHLIPGEDYQKSWGVTYYDSTLKTRFGEGAMEEHYDNFCLPIFPIHNNYSCSFISLGPTAFFVTYGDRPSWMPPVCLFSPRNNPPARDFIKHLPYASDDSKRIPGVAGYSFWVTQAGGILQVGASPDRTADEGILFGYAFDTKATRDRVDKSAAPYRHPQSFYFSGVPPIPGIPSPNAPIVSQNYTDFAMIKPDPAKTWAQVSSLDPNALPKCQLFNPPSPPWPPTTALKAGKPAAAPTWGGIGRN